MKYKPYIVTTCNINGKSKCCVYLKVNERGEARCSKLQTLSKKFKSLPEAATKRRNCIGTKSLRRIEKALVSAFVADQIMEYNSKEKKV